MTKVNIIVAYNKKDKGIGYENSIQWKIPQDIDFFRKKTINIKNNKKNCVIMGYNTWKSIKKPLKKRINIVITNKKKDIKKLKNEEEDVYYINDINIVDKMLDNINNMSNLKCVKEWENINNIYIIGGESIYKNYINKKYINNIYITEIKMIQEIKSDRYFVQEIPKYIRNIKTLEKYKNEEYEYEILKYKNLLDNNSDEYQYVNLLKHIINNGIYKDGRNGGFYTTFVNHHTFDLQKGYPLLTTKKMFFYGIIEELLFFLRGDTNSNHLYNKGIKIWQGNTNREFLDNLNLTHYKSGDMGPMYGWNWRHFGANYINCDTNYDNQGVDQLYNTIDQLVNNPTSRRIIMTTYDCSKLNQCVLPPCHGLSIQFFVRDENNHKYLDCFMFQRSSDTVLGYPFNIASYAALLIVISYVVDYLPGKLHITLGDTHIYHNHFDKIKKYIDRLPLKPPKLFINPHKTNNSNHSHKPVFDNIDQRVKFIENLTFDDFQLIDYYHYSGLKFDMVA
jgi:thymidylate synthase